MANKPLIRQCHSGERPRGRPIHQRTSRIELLSCTHRSLRSPTLSRCLTSCHDDGDQDFFALPSLVSLLQLLPHQQVLSGPSHQSGLLEMHLWRRGRWAWTVIRELSRLETLMGINCAWIYGSLPAFVCIISHGCCECEYSVDIMTLDDDQHTLSVYLWNHGAQTFS